MFLKERAGEYRRDDWNRSGLDRDVRLSRLDDARSRVSGRPRLGDGEWRRRSFESDGCRSLTRSSLTRSSLVRSSRTRSRVRDGECRLVSEFLREGERSRERRSEREYPFEVSSALVGLLLEALRDLL